MPGTQRSGSRATYVAFMVFGGFWGTWGASIPALRMQAAVTDGQLGIALLFIGVGALPAMAFIGRFVDRWGSPLAAVLLALLGFAGVTVALTAHDLRSLCVALALVGAVSGGADVAINALAGGVQRSVRRPVVTRAHGAFSVAVVLTSLSTGWLLARGAAVAVPFVILAALAVVASLRVAAESLVNPSTPAHHRSAEDEHGSAPMQASRLDAATWAMLVAVGGIAALAFAVENAHQNWSAVYLTDELLAGPALAAAGPAVFATLMAAARFAAGAFPGARPSHLLYLGALAAALGTVGVALAPNAATALTALGVAAAGTAVLFPTSIALVTQAAPDGLRGRATSVVTTTAYLGFLAGPVYVGLWSDAAGLRGAMAATAVLALIIVLGVGRVVDLAQPARSGSGASTRR